MANIVPDGRDDMIKFYANHMSAWETNMVELNLPQTTIDDLKAKLVAAQDQQAVVEQVRQTSKAETENLNALATILRATGSLVMTMIRTQAESTGDPNLYKLAEIPAPQPPKPAGPPETPIDFVADPLSNGTIELFWKGSIAQGQDYRVERSVDGGEWTLRENVRAKKWTDMAVPMNSNVIQYRVFGVRDEKRSQTAATATVNFGNLPPALQAAFRTGPNAQAA